MATGVTVWHGSTEAFQALQQAVKQNCTCTDGQPTCQPHLMLTDQRILDHLAFVSTQIGQYLEEEEHG